jgi:transposase InsO family protein
MSSKSRRAASGLASKKTSPLPVNESYVTRRYQHPRNAGSLTGLHGFLRNNNYDDKKKVEEVLSTLDAYVSHKPTRKRFYRRPMIVPKINSVWSIDLADMQNIKGSNKNYSYILVAVDALSKRLYTRPLKHKTQHETAAALESIFKKSKQHPQSIFSDSGKEFVNSSVKSLLKKYNINLYHSFSYLKAFHAERMIRTLKARLYRLFTANKTLSWVESLPDVTESINASYNSSIGTASNNVTNKNESQIWQRLYHRVITKKKIKAIFKEGDKVRVSIKKLSVGSKSYTASFGPEIFTVKKVLNIHPVPTFILQDEQGNELEGGFNQFELTKSNGSAT